MLTMPEFAFLALCRLAKPLASPGPRCSSVEAGVPFMRKYPSAAPVTTPSNRPSTQRMPSTRSRAATKCISEVPGFAKQVSTPPATRVRIRLSAPFIVLDPYVRGADEIVNPSETAGHHAVYYRKQAWQKAAKCALPPG